MTMQVVEHWTSGAENYAGNDGDIERVYHVFDDAGNTAITGITARNAVLAVAPAIDVETGLVRKTCATSPKGAGIYECKVKYSKIENKIKLTIDGSAEKIKVTKSIADIGNHKIRDLEELAATLDEAGGINANVTVLDISIANADLYEVPFEIMVDSELMQVTDLLGGFTLGVIRGHGNTTATSHLNGAVTYVLEPGPSYGGLINVGKDKVDGVDWWTPGMKLTLQWSAKYANLDPNYVTAVTAAGGFVNNADIALTIKGQEYLFLKGELVSLGGTFEDTSDDGTNISLKFEVSRNGRVSIGERDDTNVTWRSKVYKEGWHYGWIRTTTMTSNGIRIDVPNSFHVAQVGNYLDFDIFGVFDTIVDDPPAEEE